MRASKGPTCRPSLSTVHHDNDLHTSLASRPCERCTAHLERSDDGPRSPLRSEPLGTSTGKNQAPGRIYGCSSSSICPPGFKLHRQTCSIGGLSASPSCWPLIVHIAGRLHRFVLACISARVLPHRSPSVPCKSCSASVPVAACASSPHPNRALIHLRRFQAHAHSTLLPRATTQHRTAPHCTPRTT
jgi:hypothetical protein